MPSLFDFNNVGNIPDEMKNYRQWICWKIFKSSKNYTVGTRSTKVPIDPNTITLGSSIDMSTWATFDQAVAAIRDNPNQNLGLGFVFTQDDPFAFVDFDSPAKLLRGGLNADKVSDEIKTGRQVITHQQIQLVDKLQTYSEISPSKKGLHCYCTINKALYPNLTGRRSNYAEIYFDKRFATITGEVYRKFPVEYRHSVIDDALADFEIATDYSLSALLNNLDTPAVATDVEVLNMASMASNRDKFNKLWAGDIHTWHHGDHSRADFALIDMLAFYTQNVEQICRLFRQSVLGQRDKANRDDYVLSMVSKAISDKVPTVDIDLASLESQLTKAIEGSGIARSAPPGINVGVGIASNLELGETVARAATIKEKIETIQSRYSREGVEIPQDVTISLDEISDPPGLVGNIADFFYRSSRKPVPQIALVGAIGFLAGIVGRPYCVFGKGLNVYLMMQAKTGRGKEAIAEGHNKLYAACQREGMPQINDFRGPGDLASGQGLLRYLSNSRVKACCSIFGEFGKMLRRITADKASAADLMIQKVLLDIYGKSGRDSVIEPTQYSDAEKNTQPIPSPAFSIIGETTPKWLNEHFAFGMIDSGLLPRFITVNYDGERVPTNEGHHLVQPHPDMIRLICGMTHQSLTYIANCAFYEIEFTSQAMEMSKRLDRFCDLRINLAGGDASSEIWNRVHLNTAKVAGLLAVGINYVKPVIDEVCWEWAEKFVIFCAMQMEMKFESGDVVVTDDPLAHLRIIERLIAMYLDAGAKPEGYLEIAADQELVIAKIITYKWLVNKASRIAAFRQAAGGPTRMVKAVLDQMMESGEIIEIPRAQTIKDFGSHGRMFMPTVNLVKRLTRM